MLNHALQRFDPFRSLTWTELSTVARHTQVLNLPANRWLLREGRRLNGSYYLARGRLCVCAPPREVRHTARAARRPVYPGSVSIRTLSQTQLLHVDTRPIEFLLGGARDEIGVEATFEPWERRFLGSPLLKRLAPSAWQRLFSELEERPIRPGENLVQMGDAAHAFYLLKAGHASVHRRGKTLAYLGPGDFFGEDALITRSHRNATVTALEEGWLLELSRERFFTLLADKVVRCVQSSEPCTRICVGDDKPANGDLHIPIVRLRETMATLEHGERYHVVGGEANARALAAFILTQHGFDAWVA